jgi:hypothetical protein
MVQVTEKVEDEIHETNTQVNPAATATEVKEAEHAEATEKVETHKEEAQAIEPKANSPEQAAAERAGVSDEALDSEKQNRAPKNKFEAENQKVTETVRKAAQKESDMTTEQREKKAETPKETATKDAGRTAEVNQGSEIAAAIAAGLAGAKEDKSIKIVTDDSVEPRFSVVKNKHGEVFVRENETGVLSRVQLESIEEKEASIQGQDVEEV